MLVLQNKIARESLLSDALIWENNVLKMKEAYSAEDPSPGLPINMQGATAKFKQKFNNNLPTNSNILMLL